MIKESFSLDGELLTRSLSISENTSKTFIDLKSSSSKVLDQTNLGKLWWQFFLKSERQSPHSTNHLNIVDLFCSAGGLSLGAYEAAIAAGLKPRTLFCSDSDNDALNV